MAGYVIPSGWLSSGSSIRTGCCSDEIQMGSDTRTTVSSTMGVTHLKKTGGVKGAQNLFRVFSLHCWTGATLRPSLGDSPRAVDFLPSLSCPPLQSSVWTVGQRVGRFAVCARGHTLNPSSFPAFSRLAAVGASSSWSAVRVSAESTFFYFSSSSSPHQNSSPNARALGYISPASHLPRR